MFLQLETALRDPNNSAINVGSTRDYCNLFVLTFEPRYLDLLHCADEYQKGRNSCPCFISSGLGGVLQSYFFT